MDPVLVIGAGVGGLAVGLELRRLGLAVRVLEASERAGGGLRTSVEHGFQYEHGPTLLFDRDPALRALIDRIGLRNRLLNAGPEAGVRSLYLRGRLRILPQATRLLTSDLLSIKGRMRIFAELATPRPRSEDESILEFGSRHFGEEATRTLVDPLVGALFAGDIARLSARGCFPAVHALGARHRSLVVGLAEEYRGLKRGTESRPALGNLISFLDGLEELPRAMAAALGDSLRFGARVTRVVPAAHGVAVELSGGERLTGSAAVIAVDARTGAGLLRAPLPRAASLMEPLPYAPVALVHLGFPRRAIGAELCSLGFFAPSTEKLDLIGCLYTSSLYPARAPTGQVLLTAILGGATRPEIATLDESALIARALDQLRPLLEIGGDPVFTRAVSTPRAVPQYVVGWPSRLQSLRDELQAAGPLFLAGNAFEGIGIADCVRRAGPVAEAVRDRVLGR